MAAKRQKKVAGLLLSPSKSGKCYRQIYSFRWSGRVRKRSVFQIKMNAIPLDTTIEAARKQFEILRKLGPEVRVKMAFEMSNNLRSIVEAGTRLRHPDYNEQQIQKEVIRLMIGDTLFRQIYPDTKI